MEKFIEAYKKAFRKENELFLFMHIILAIAWGLFIFWASIIFIFWFVGGISFFIRAFFLLLVFQSISSYITYLVYKE